jgi:hypothetical protein
MFKSAILAGAALLTGATAVLPTAADAQRYHGQRYEQRYDRYDGRYDGRRYYSRDRYRHSYRARGCDNTGGLVVGAIAGGLLGNAVDGGRNRTAGTLGGAVLGALAGRAIDRSDNPGYCRR